MPLNLKFNIKVLLIVAATIFLCSACAKNTDIKELIKKNGVVFKKNSKIPFTGVAVSFYGDDKGKKSETKYIDGLKEGLETFWYRSGNVKLKKPYIKGRLHGETILWYTNGQKKSVETYKNGKKIGRQRYWEKNGTLKKDKIIH